MSSFLRHTSWILNQSSGDGEYLPREGESPQNALWRCYKELLSFRNERYGLLSDCVLDYSFHHCAKTGVEELLELVKNNYKMKPWISQQNAYLFFNIKKQQCSNHILDCVSGCLKKILLSAKILSLRCNFFWRKYFKQLFPINYFSKSIIITWN